MLSIHHVGDGPGQIRWRQAELAMALRGKNAHYALAGIQARHWQALAAREGPAVWAQMLALRSAMDRHWRRWSTLLPAAFRRTSGTASPLGCGLSVSAFWTAWPQRP